MRYFYILVVFLLLAAVSSCSPAPAATQSAASVPHPTSTSHGDPQSTSDLAPHTSVQVEIKGKMIYVDRVVHGFLCDDSWSGTIYVDDDVQVAEWEDNPFFFKDCNLSIEPATIIYVAAHNDDQFLKGCTCHE